MQSVVLLQFLQACQKTSVSNSNAFENFFGYSSSVDVQDYDWNDVMSEIDASRPVILRGDDGGNVGHAWIADGYREVYDCSMGFGYLFSHMNWGWEGNYNGFYSV